MKAVGLGILFIAAMLVGALSIYHIWEWLSLLSEGESTWGDLVPTLGWLGILGVAAFAVSRGVEQVDSGHGHEHGHGHGV